MHRWGVRHHAPSSAGTHTHTHAPHFPARLSVLNFQPPVQALARAPRSRAKGGARTVGEGLGGGVQDDDATLGAVADFVHHLDLELLELVGGLLEELAEVLDGELEVLLDGLEDVRLVVALEVEGEGVRPLERLPALLQALGRGLQELHLDPRHVRVRLELRHLLLRLERNVLVQPRRLLVVRVPVVIMQVALQGGARPRLRVPRVLPALLVEPAAVVPARAVLLPQAHAHPAEFVAALAARHVVAAPVLLNGRVALGALLGVGRNPVGRLRVVGALLQPPLDERAWRRLVIGDATAEAEGVTAFAMHRGHNAVQVFLLDAAFQGVFAIRSGAPLEVFLVIHICP